VPVFATGLQVGGSAEVYGTASANGLKVRSGPGTGYSQVGTIYDGTIVKILDGPTANNGYTWWKHDHGGWSAENWLRSVSSNGNTVPTNDGATFQSDLSVADGSQYLPGQSFDKGWRIFNSGGTTWSSFQAVRTGGDFGPGSFSVPPVSPGQTGDLWARGISVPSSPGHYRATYRLQGPRGQFGDSFWVDINVQSTNIPSPSVPVPATLTNPKIAFVSNRDGAWNIYIMNPDGTKQTRLTTDGANSQPQWSPDGSKLVFWSDRDGNYEIYTMNVDGSNQTRLTFNSVYDFDPAWSPDGTRIAFVRNYSIYVMNSDGSNQTSLATGGRMRGSPRWSPDGKKIAYNYGSGSPDSTIFIMNADGSNQIKLDVNPGDGGSLAWSPDEQKIAFTSNRDGKWGIFVMNADGSNQIRLTSNSVDPGNPGPTWSPDGSKISYRDGTAWHTQIYLINSDGSGQTKLTNNSYDNFGPAWSPSGNPFSNPNVALPSLTSLTPDRGNQGQTVTNVSVDGTNLSGATVLDCSGIGVTASNLSVNAAGTQITADVVVASDAVEGARDVTVTTPDGISATLVGGFTVTASEIPQLSVSTSGTFYTTYKTIYVSSPQGIVTSKIWDKASIPLRLKVMQGTTPVPGVTLSVDGMQLQNSTTNSDGICDVRYPVDLTFFTGNFRIFVNGSVGSSQLSTQFDLFKNEQIGSRSITVTKDEADWYSTELLEKYAAEGGLSPEWTGALPSSLSHVGDMLSILDLFAKIALDLKTYQPQEGDTISSEGYKYSAAGVETAYAFHQTIQRAGSKIYDITQWTDSIDLIQMSTYLIVRNATVGSLASPATFWVTNPNEMHAGINPTTGTANFEFQMAITPPSEPHQRVIIPTPLDGQYKFGIYGTANGSYGFVCTSINEAGDVSNIFSATGIPTSPKACHQYILDWNALSQGKPGVIVNVDLNGDGIFEQSFSSGTTLTSDQFMATAPSITLPSASKLSTISARNTSTPAKSSVFPWSVIAGFLVGLLIIIVITSIIINKRRNK
jgi:Tol biopolymer transport system component